MKILDDEYFAFIEERGSISRQLTPDLAARVSLQAYGIANKKGLVEEEALEAIIKAEATTLAQDFASIEGIFSSIETSHLQRHHVDFGSVESADARRISERGHYLRSFRGNAANFGLYSSIDNKLLGFCSLAPLDWVEILNLLNETLGVTDCNCTNLARIYTRPNSPKNSISLLLHRISSLERSKRDVDMLATVVDPNIGFSGVSYRASGWIKFAEIEHQGFPYLDGRYVTRRTLRSQFGSENPEALSQTLGERFSLSICPMQPVQIYVFPLYSRLRRKLEEIGVVQ